MNKTEEMRVYFDELNNRFYEKQLNDLRRKEVENIRKIYLDDIELPISPDYFTSGLLYY